MVALYTAPQAPFADWRNARTNLAGYQTNLQQYELAAADRANIKREQALGDLSVEQARWELQQQKEAWALKKSQADASGKLATQFLSQWGGAMTDLKSMFGEAGKALTSVTQLLSGEAGKMPAEFKDYLSQITDLQNMIRDQYKEYTAETAPLQRELWQAAREETGARKEITQRLLEEGKARPEDAAMRAGTDVKIQAELGEREAARELMSMGVDPSAGRFGALSRRSAIQTAGEQAKAMNAARIAERNRATNVNLAAMGQLKPEQLITAGTGMREAGTKMLGTSAEVAKAGADIVGKQQAIDIERMKGITQLGQAYGNLATQYAGAITKPYSELAGYFMGQANPRAIQV